MKLTDGVAHLPLSMDLMGFQAADGNSGLATLGVRRIFNRQVPGAFG